MRLTGAVGFVLTVLGIAGMDGAIRFGTGYLTATALLVMGAAGLYIDYRLEGTGKGKREWKFAGYAKETVIPGNWSAEYVRNVWRKRGGTRSEKAFWAGC